MLESVLSLGRPPMLLVRDRRPSRLTSATCEVEGEATPAPDEEPVTWWTALWNSVIDGDEILGALDAEIATSSILKSDQRPERAEIVWLSILERS